MLNIGYTSSSGTNSSNNEKSSRLQLCKIVVYKRVVFVHEKKTKIHFQLPNNQQQRKNNSLLTRATDISLHFSFLCDPNWYTYSHTPKRAFRLNVNGMQFGRERRECVRENAGMNVNAIDASIEIKIHQLRLIEWRQDAREYWLWRRRYPL